MVKRLATLELEVTRKKLSPKLTVANEGDVAHGIARALVDHERQQRPVASRGLHDFQFPAHPRLEKTQAAVVGRDQVDVFVDFLPVDIASEQPKDAWLRLDLSQEASVARDRVADKTRPKRFTAATFVDEKDSSFIADLIALNGGYFCSVVALLVQMGFDTTPGLFDHIRIH